MQTLKYFQTPDDDSLPNSTRDWFSQVFQYISEE